MLSTDRHQVGRLANPRPVNKHSDYPATRRRVLIALQAQMALGLVGCSSGGGSAAPATSASKGPATSTPQRHYSPDHKAYDYSDHFSSNVSDDAAAFTRMIEDGHGLMHVNPGARIRFATDSARIGISLRYSAGLVRRRFSMALAPFWSMARSGPRLNATGGTLAILLLR